MNPTTIWTRFNAQLDPTLFSKPEDSLANDRPLPRRGWAYTRGGIARTEGVRTGRRGPEAFGLNEGESVG